jgi:hypothetical protein
MNNLLKQFPLRNPLEAEAKINRSAQSDQSAKTNPSSNLLADERD